MILKKLPLILAVSALLLFNSCIQDEPLNAECDIVMVDQDWIQDNQDILMGNDPIKPQSNTRLSITVKKGIDRSHLDPKFILTPGAKITMAQNGQQVEANGAIRDFTTPQTYTVHSQDRMWSKDYVVSFSYPSPTTFCDFEHFDIYKKDNYYVWYEEDPNDPTNPRRDYWATGNAGFAATGKGGAPEEFPTCVDPNSKNGNGVVMITRNTGSFAALAGMPIAAGNIFIGEFIPTDAMSHPLEATLFGKREIVGGKPITLSGYYKYALGDKFVNNNKHGIASTYSQDSLDIYSVLYEVEDPAQEDSKIFVPLNGANIKSSNRIVAITKRCDLQEAKDWTSFTLDFEYKKEFDIEKLNNNGYALTIVATSSRNGDHFVGSIGSTLHIDDFKITWEEQ